jgi:ABC-type lipoprotein release transport system permease subunit
MLMGERLARRLQVDVGDKVVVSVQEVGGGLTGQALRIGGLFRTASSELDQGTLVLRIDEAQQLFGLGDGVNEVVALAQSDREIEALRAGVATLLGDVAEVRSWEELQPLLVYMVDTFDSMAWAVYGAVFIAMAFGIANVLLMAVYERTREIGMMRAMGMRKQRVVALIVIESLLVVLFGLVVGNALALASLWALGDGIDLSAYAEGLGMFGVGARILPVVRGDDFAIPLAVASLSALIASLWPAIRAARLRPADALRKL